MTSGEKAIDAWCQCCLEMFRVIPYWKDELGFQLIVLIQSVHGLGSKVRLYEFLERVRTLADQQSIPF